MSNKVPITRKMSAIHFGEDIDDDRHGPYKHHFVCFRCRKVFKPHANTRSQFHDNWAVVSQCPDCGGEVWDCGQNFKAPKRRKVRAWRRLEAAVAKHPTYLRSDPRRIGQRLEKLFRSRR